MRGWGSERVLRVVWENQCVLLSAALCTTPRTFRTGSDQTVRDLANPDSAVSKPKWQEMKQGHYEPKINPYFKTFSKTYFISNVSLRHLDCAQM